MTAQKDRAILIVDDEKGNVESLRRIFEREGFSVLTGYDGREGLDLLRQEQIDLLVCDVMMPKIDGLDLLKAVKTISPQTEVILVTAYGTVERAVEAMKLGAYDFLTKPLKRREIVKAVQKALEKIELLEKQNLIEQENRRLRDRVRDLEESQPRIVGQSAALRRTLDVVRQAAPAQATVLIQGESGTGKELIAREIHRLSGRHDKGFVAVNCAAIPETLLESELFGYEKGAFTGAVASKPGRFELADGGTLFLDEIGELSTSMQVKLLRVLQENEIERLGATRPTPIDIRLLAATNRTLSEELEEGRFREDLYYRLNVIEIRVPPLRERAEDIPLLVHHFIAHYAQKNQKPPLSVAPETMEILQRYRWPGNVRELENVIERAVVLSTQTIIHPSELPPSMHDEQSEDNYLLLPFGTPLDEIERRVIVETLRRTGGDKKLAAQLLGIATRTIYRKLESMNQ